MRFIQLMENQKEKDTKKMYNFISDLLNMESEITIDFSNLKRIDISTVKMFLKLQKKAEIKNRNIYLTGVPTDFIEQVQISLHGNLLK